MKKILLLSSVIMLLTIGCIVPKGPKVEDPCAKVPKLCWGKAGQSPSDVEVCAAVIACSDWVLMDRSLQ